MLYRKPVSRVFEEGSFPDYVLTVVEREYGLKVPSHPLSIRYGTLQTVEARFWLLRQSKARCWPSGAGRVKERHHGLAPLLTLKPEAGHSRRAPSLTSSSREGVRPQGPFTPHFRPSEYGIRNTHPPRIVIGPQS